ncbi:MAG: DUF2344 domain-containing protein [Clostridiaceae bacterium]|nr:DUF2344 domain-containing protein [Clostridiaceae bacterium]
MSRVRIKYSKEEPVKYISHLDVLRVFNRAIRRAGLPVAYSQGFNPHPQISFGLPLPVGYTSAAEYLEMEMDGEVDANKLIVQLNKEMPEGMRILKAVVLDDKDEKVSGIISMADYKVTVFLEEKFNGDLVQYVNHIMALDEVNVEKQGKKGTKKVNIRPNIYLLEVEEQQEKMLILKMCLSAGSQSNLKPDLVLQALESLSESFRVEFFKVHRMKLLDREGFEIM